MVEEKIYITPSYTRKAIDKYREKNKDKINEHNKLYYLNTYNTRKDAINEKRRLKYREKHPKNQTINDDTID